MEKYTAIVLAAGVGKRMNSKIQKQYMLLGGKPVLFYALDAFEKSRVDEIILVVGKGEIEYCRKEIVEKYKFHKVTKIVEGGKERYHSVYEGLKAIDTADYVLIHDGARPFLNQQILARAMEAVKQYQACVVGMPVKDTIKITTEDGFSKETPERKHVWMIQTPQCFSYPLIFDVYQKMLQNEDTTITDDAMVLEKVKGLPVKMVEGSYRNIKITTPEDLLVAEAYLGDIFQDV
ncbi:MAG: 2-C-methyl-D-erythritol 4-phosphate cytidylyltransferase [Roseburia sp.]|uniref:2-C-methyl-D-erythritol 4-phosphate cytidylyltransferase n=1 Tax=Roseburia sp. 831b TaxID=1261635 RepID=UPI000950D578|nr:2-C-methyl-D-erythritol 4-phosphate cytidylyltransferase [Roseburia sp. 831b]MCI5919834.1 2-C-methyl-D-erythritol 4-phosphate cytidylyltransferase [Roseburia sp.]MDD6215235.1 2-C-methyl-D-erythritol 4-phosphate cytidylyltransferase [Roseburia sp.]MDY5882276.1 2-C-methyl-D-erythritol 4-phosphate cytidylyltransferase [Roseburia sp.]WVK72205.1 2-C-methyl-D-erythritol 4-phosphate cytidylyltransferase [Roseburia sp. 831b]